MACWEACSICCGFSNCAGGCVICGLLNCTGGCVTFALRSATVLILAGTVVFVVVVIGSTCCLLVLVLGSFLFIFVFCSPILEFEVTDGVGGCVTGVAGGCVTFGDTVTILVSMISSS